MKMTKPSELDQALRYFAETYHGAVVGSEWDEACDIAETVANNFRWSHGREAGPFHDDLVAHHLYSEAARYADM
jgi:hypothetical protein